MAPMRPMDVIPWGRRGRLDFVFEAACSVDHIHIASCGDAGLMEFYVKV